MLTVNKCSKASFNQFSDVDHEPQMILTQIKLQMRSQTLLRQILKSFFSHTATTLGITALLGMSRFLYQLTKISK
jgi:hypothetical protein